MKRKKKKTQLPSAGHIYLEVVKRKGDLNHVMYTICWQVVVSCLLFNKLMEPVELALEVCWQFLVHRSLLQGGQGGQEHVCFAGKMLSEGLPESNLY